MPFWTKNGACLCNNEAFVWLTVNAILYKYYYVVSITCTTLVRRDLGRYCTVLDRGQTKQKRVPKWHIFRVAAIVPFTTMAFISAQKWGLKADINTTINIWCPGVGGRLNREGARYLGCIWGSSKLASPPVSLSLRIVAKKARWAGNWATNT